MHPFLLLFDYFLFLFLLQLLAFFSSLIALRLRFSAGRTLGCRSLKSKAGPRTEILATLAPLDLRLAKGGRFKAFVHYDPNLTVTSGTDALILGGNGGFIASILPIRFYGGFGFEGTFQSAHFALILGNVRIVGQHHEFWQVYFGCLFHIALKVGW